MIGRTERRKDGGKKAEKNRRERKKRKEGGSGGRKRNNKKERRKGKDRLPTGGVFVEKNTKKSNASLPLISVKKIEQSEHFFSLFEQRRQCCLKLELFTRQTKLHVNKTISVPTPSLAPHCGST